MSPPFSFRRVGWIWALCAAGLLALPVFSIAAPADGGESIAPYLSMGLGNRESALGDASVALEGDVTSVFHNPAGLAGVRTFHFYSQYAFLTFDRTLSCVALGGRLERSPFSWALGWVYFSAGKDLEAREGPSWDPLYTFSDNQMAGVLGLAYRFGTRWQAGINLKLLTHNLDDQMGWGYGGDAGCQVRLADGFLAGLELADLLNQFRFSGSPLEKTNPEARLGVSRTFGGRWTATLQAASSSGLGLWACGGLEWRPVSGVFLRTGYGDGAWRGGFGVSVLGGRLDKELQYTFMPDKMNGGILHQVSLSLWLL